MYINCSLHLVNVTKARIHWEAYDNLNSCTAVLFLVQVNLFKIDTLHNYAAHKFSINLIVFEWTFINKQIFGTITKSSLRQRHGIFAFQQHFVFTCILNFQKIMNFYLKFKILIFGLISPNNLESNFTIITHFCWEN